MASSNGFRVTPDDLSRFQTGASDLAAQLPGYASRYSSVMTPPGFGGLNFPAARDLLSAYQDQLDNFVSPSGQTPTYASLGQSGNSVSQGSNLSDLAAQVNLIAQGAGSAATGYQTTATQESTATTGVMSSVTGN